jgi:hypothetical protein
MIDETATFTFDYSHYYCGPVAIDFIAIDDSTGLAVDDFNLENYVMLDDTDQVYLEIVLSERI